MSVLHRPAGRLKAVADWHLELVDTLDELSVRSEEDSLVLYLVS